MSEQSDKIKGVRATVMSVNRLGWATARVTRRATNHTGTTISESETISIMPKFGFGRGDDIRCIVTRSSRRNEDWFAIAAQPFVERTSQVSWAPWQDGRKNLVQSIPDTAPGSDHDGIEFGCWRCGNNILQPEAIHRIKSTAVWTNTAELSGVIIDEGIRYNKWKRCDIQNVRCQRCGGDFGTHYAEPYYDSDTKQLISGTQQVFPCIKVTTNREMRDGEKPDIVAVLLGDDMGVVRDAIAHLQPSAEWQTVKHLATGGRVDADVHRMRQQAMLARDREAAERREREAAEAAAAKAATDVAVANARARHEAQQAEAAITEAHRAEAAAHQAERQRVRADQQAMQQRRISEQLRREAAEANAEVLVARDEQAQAVADAAEHQSQAVRAAEEAEAAANRQRAAQVDADSLAEQLAAVRVGCGDVTWECEIDNGSWSQFSKEISALLERANRTHSVGGAVQQDFLREGIKYRADFARMTQLRYDTGMERTIRRTQRVVEVVSTISCRDELRAALPALGLPGVDGIIRTIDRRLADIGVRPGAVDYDHRFVFFLYTMDACYAVFNDALRDRAGPRFDAWSPIRWHLNQALAAQPDVRADVLRGMSAQNVVEYKTDKRIHWSGFSSTTTDLAVARQFAGPAGVIFKLKVQNAKDIRRFSWFGGSEGELLLSPNMEFVVTQELHTPREGILRGCRVIEMQQIPDATLWS